jgi:hypothetical protein
MRSARIRRDAARAAIQLFLLLLFSLAPRIGFAYKGSFEGSLISNNATDPPTVLVLNFESNIAGVYGDVRMTGATKKVLTGVEVQGMCDLRVDLGGSRMLVMKGACSRAAQIFEGSYWISSLNYKRQSGVFRLTKTKGDNDGRIPGEGEGGSRRFSGPTPARCIHANVACLLGCQRGEYDAELLCTNRCKAKLNTCKASGGTTDGGPSDSQ